MRENPKPFERYQHFKGKQYQILTLAKDSETGKDVVVYQALYGDYTVYVRELTQFMSPVDHAKYPDVTQEYRFEKCESDVTEQSFVQPVTSPGVSETAEPISGGQETDNRISDGQEADDRIADGQEAYLDPMVVEFLDADRYEEKLNILAGAHRKITDDMLEIMAVASNVELNEGSTEEKYTELRNCLLTMEKFECDRIR